MIGAVSLKTNRSLLNGHRKDEPCATCCVTYVVPLLISVVRAMCRKVHLARDEASRGFVGRMPKRGKRDTREKRVYGTLQF